MARQRQVGIEWQLRKLMAERGLYSTTDLAPLLEARGVHLSATQVYRLVAQAPERLNMKVLAAVCDALDCSPADLIAVTATPVTRRTRAAADGSGTTGGLGAGEGDAMRPRRVKLVDE